MDTNETNTEEEALRAEMKKKDEIIERLEERLRKCWKNVRDDMNNLETVYEEDEGESFFAGNASKNH